MADRMRARDDLAASPYRFSPSPSRPAAFDVEYLAAPSADPHLSAQWSFYHGGSIARLTVQEKQPLHPRYTLKDVVLPRLADHAAPASPAQDPSSRAISFGPGRSLRLDPGRRVFSLFVNDTQLLTVNSRGLFSFEHSRPKHAPAAAPAREKDGDEDGDGDDDEELEALLKDDDEPDVEPDDDGSAFVLVNSKDGGWEESFGGHPDSKPRGPQSVSLDITFVGAKHVFGVPEHAASFSLKDTRGGQGYSEPYRLYNLDVFEYELDNPMALYGSVPIMLAQCGAHTVGVFWANAAETWVDVEHLRAEQGVHSHWISETGNLDVFFFLGPSPADVLAQIAAVTGTPDIPPLFSLAYHQCRWNYKSQADVADVDAGFDEHVMPYDVLWLDIEHTDGKRYFTWDSSHFPSPKSMVEAVSAKGRQMVTIVDPHIKRDQGYYVHAQAAAEGYYVKKRDGTDYEGWCWPGSSSWVDYTLPAARFWWEGLFSYDKYSGSTPNLYTWNDMNEPSVFNGPEVTMHKDALHYGDVEHRELHNVVGLEFHKATAIGLIKRNPGHNARPFVLSRAFFAGTQRWGAVWTGDNDASWGHLAASTPMLLSIGIVGIPFAGADVGGFFNNPDPQLLVRWYQAGAFQPFFRGHAHLDTKRREPWLFGEPTTSLIRQALRTRYSLLPYWYTLFAAAARTGTPPMRPVWFDHPHVADAFAVEDQFMVGTDILVKPVTTADSTSTSVFFPASGPWYELSSLEAVHVPVPGRLGGIQTPLEKIPVYQRGGSIIPKWERARRSSSQMVGDPFTLQVALDHAHSASGELYLDDFNSFDYQKGVYLTQRFTFQDNTLVASSQHPSALSVKNTIERIRILGYPKEPTSIHLVSSSSSNTPLEFSYSSSSKILTIRKPQILITSEFKIEIQLK